MTDQSINGIAIQPGSVKICGLRDREHAIAATQAGADLLGFIFAPTRRYVAPHIARDAILAARAVSTRPFLAVGVFVNASGDEMGRIAREAGLDVIQLSGDEAPDVISTLKLPVLRAIRPAPGATAADVLADVSRTNGQCPVAYVLDGFHAGHYGGTGVRADWRLAAELSGQIPTVLAGGLSPDNVAAAIGTVNPLGVDVSTGVERDGVKDAGLIAAFVDAAREAFRGRG